MATQYVTTGYVSTGYVAGSNYAFSLASVALVQLVYFGFASPLALNTSTWDISYGGVTYKGAYGLGSISAINDKPGEVQGLTLDLAGGPSSNISLALDGSGAVPGTPLVIRTAVFDTASYTVIDAPIEWTGTLDTMTISEDGNTAVVRVSAESRAVDLLRGNAWQYSDEDQTAVLSSDRSFRYVIDQIDKRIVWPTREFFYK